ncbi:MAG: PatB family C-S lyase [Prolixibacteraceae bacterium]|jgi:cystathionine beta-lyase|nr:PatB family C-S lyase [Prolixibacteraceae bacterium]
MKYNFDEIIEREGTNCQKYDNRELIFGKTDVIPMWVADSDFKTPDFIVKAIKQRAAHEIYGYPLKPESFYESIINWQKRRHNWVVERNWIEYSSNVVVGLASVVLSMTNPGDKIIVQPPVYFPFFHVIEGNKRVMVENPLVNRNGRYHFDIDDLIAKIDDDTKMLFLCNPHNPGGMVWTENELKELGEVCLKHNVIVVSDEIHADLVFKGHEHVPFAKLSDEFAKNSITLMSASKTFNIAGLSSAYLFIPDKELRIKYQKLMKATHLSSGNFFGLVATEEAYTYGDEWLEELLVYLEGNFEFIMKYIAENLPRIKVMQPEGTYLPWLDMSGLSIDAHKAYKILIEYGLGLTPGNMFGTGGENFIRLNMACPRSVLAEGLGRMKEALAAY